MVQLTILKPRQYCVVVGALGKDGRPQLGHRELRCGPLTFFLQPGWCIYSSHDVHTMCVVLLERLV